MFAIAEYDRLLVGGIARCTSAQISHSSAEPIPVQKDSIVAQRLLKVLVDGLQTLSYVPTCGGVFAFWSSPLVCRTTALIEGPADAVARSRRPDRLPWVVLNAPRGHRLQA